MGLAKEHMEAMKADIIRAVSRYMVVDHESIEMDMRRSGESLVLVSNIQVKDIVRAAATGNTPVRLVNGRTDSTLSGEPWYYNNGF